MKILILGDNNSVHIQKWIKAVADYPEVVLDVITFDKGVKIEGVNYHFLKKITGTKLDYFLNVLRVRTFIKKIKPELVHAHYATSYGFLGMFSNFKPFIVTGWGADIFDSPKSIFLKCLLKKTFKNANSISVLSEITRIEMKKLTDKHVHLIPFGVDITKFSSAEKTTDGIIRIGTIRTLSEKYGVEYLIRAFAELTEKHTNIELHIVGDGPLRVKFEELVVELNIENKVVFYGYVNQNSDFEKYIKILSNFDIFCILSILDSETFGVAAVEASSCEIPVVASSVGGLPEVVEDGKTGIIVAPKSVDQTFKALEILVNDPNLRLEMGKNGRLKVEKMYNWKSNTQQMIDLYKATIEQFKK